jgi:plasmid maintenance system antidote protein VapI
MAIKLSKYFNLMSDIVLNLTHEVYRLTKTTTDNKNNNGTFKNQFLGRFNTWRK